MEEATKRVYALAFKYRCELFIEGCIIRSKVASSYYKFVFYTKKKEKKKRKTKRTQKNIKVTIKSFEKNFAMVAGHWLYHSRIWVIEYNQASNLMKA